jgi:hypothetical protein
VPVGGVHTLSNDADAIAEMLILFTPGGTAGGVLRGLGRIAASGRRLTGDELVPFLAEDDQYLPA